MTEDETTEDSTGLPASFELAWGFRERTSKGPKRGLTLNQILHAGVKVAVTDGFGAVSMSRVAGELGASTMSLYRYISSKEELLELMADTAFGPPPTHPDDMTGWRPLLENWAVSMLRMQRQHPWTLRVPLSGPPTTPNQMRWLESGLQSLAETELLPQEKMSVILLVSGFVRNEVLVATQLNTAALAAGKEFDAVMADYNRFLTRVVTHQHFPELAKVVESAVMDHADGPDDEFNWGLRRILDGLELHINQISDGP